MGFEFGGRWSLFDAEARSNQKLIFGKNLLGGWVWEEALDYGQVGLPTESFAFFRVFLARFAFIVDSSMTFPKFSIFPHKNESAEHFHGYFWGWTSYADPSHHQNLDRSAEEPPRETNSGLVLEISVGKWWRMGLCWESRCKRTWAQAQPCEKASVRLSST